ncbi:hypothetical protein BDE02_05G029200 [Populus trichocarpa]|nr:hypothetical protein BDE02_05G029200 [Populus trichocarpa]
MFPPLPNVLSLLVRTNSTKLGLVTITVGLVERLWWSVWWWTWRVTRRRWRFRWWCWRRCGGGGVLVGEVEVCWWWIGSWRGLRSWRRCRCGLGGGAGGGGGGGGGGGVVLVAVQVMAGLRAGRCRWRRRRVVRGGGEEGGGWLVGHGGLRAGGCRGGLEVVGAVRRCAVVVRVGTCGAGGGFGWNWRGWNGIGAVQQGICV